MPHYQLNEVAVFADQHGIGFLRCVKNGTVSGVPQTNIADSNRVDRKGLLSNSRAAVATARPAIVSCGESCDAAALRTKMQAGANVFCFKIGKIRKNRLFSDALRQHFENVRYANTHSTYTSATAALICIEGDPFIKCHFCTH